MTTDGTKFIAFGAPHSILLEQMITKERITSLMRSFLCVETPLKPPAFEPIAGTEPPFVSTLT